MNPNLIKIGVTGGIGAGKSVVCTVFSHLGIPIYNADDRAKWLMANDPELTKKIKFHFGERSYEAGKLNRPFLAKHVFNDKKKLHTLNNLVHPAVGRDFRQWLGKLEKTPYCIKEAALLFESGSYRELDKTILVYSPEAVRIERVLKRDPHRSEKDVNAIIGNQMDEDEKKKHADYVVVNDGRKMILPQILDLHKKLSNRSKD